MAVLLSHHTPYTRLSLTFLPVRHLDDSSCSGAGERREEREKRAVTVVGEREGRGINEDFPTHWWAAATATVNYLKLGSPIQEVLVERRRLPSAVSTLSSVRLSCRENVSWHGAHAYRVYWSITGRPTGLCTVSLRGELQELI